MNQPPSENKSSAADDSSFPTTTTVSPDRRAPRWLIFFRPKVGIPLAILLMLAAIPLGYRSARIASLPPIDEPFDVEAFCAVTIPDDENAFVEYRQAFDLFVDDTASSSDWDYYDDLNRGRWEHVPAAFEKWISANEKSIEKWLKGTQKPNAMSVPRSQLSYPDLGYPGEGRGLTRLALMTAGRHLSRNETAEAWKLYHAAFRFSRHLGQNSSLYGRIWGFSSHAITVSELLSWAGHSESTATDLEHAITVLSRDYATMTPPYSTTLKHEHFVLKDCLKSFAGGREIFVENPLLDTAVIFVRGEPEFSESLIDHVLKNQLAGVDHDLATRPTFVPRNQCLFDLAASPSRPVSGAGLANLMSPLVMIDQLAGIPRLKHLLAGRDNERCFQATMMAVLAVEHFVRLHGRFPESLNECADPSSVQPFPDPHQPVYKQLLFSNDGNFAVVFSVGLDGIDDSHSPQPPAEEEQRSWSQLRNSDGRFEGYRIPLWRSASEVKGDEVEPVVPDNVQD